jgi:hypothetical protein
LQQNSLLNRTGNFCEGTGNFVRENREFERGEVQNFRMMFSEGTSNVCPAPNHAVALDLSARLPPSLMLGRPLSIYTPWFAGAGLGQVVTHFLTDRRLCRPLSVP